MASSNLNDVCCICQKKLLKGSECDEAYTNVNDRNVSIIERFSNSWKEPESSRHNKCVNACQKYKEEKCELSFHVKCYQVLISNGLGKSHETSQANIERCKKYQTSAAGPSTHDSTAPSGSKMSSSDKECIHDAALILREHALKLPNGIFNDYADDPMMYTFFANICGVFESDIGPSKNEEMHKKILVLCQEFAASVHKHESQQSETASKEELDYLVRLIMNAMFSNPV